MQPQQQAVEPQQPALSEQQPGQPGGSPLQNPVGLGAPSSSDWTVIPVHSFLNDLMSLPPHSIFRRIIT